MLQAIVDGEPPDLPKDSFSLISRDFVAGCLNKIPKLRPTYPMLLQHAWLAPLAKPSTIVEEDEEAAEAADAAGEAQVEASGNSHAADGSDSPFAEPTDGYVDREVGLWVQGALDRRKRGVMGQAPKPALHAAPLDAVGVGSPGMEGAKAVAVDA